MGWGGGIGEKEGWVRRRDGLGRRNGVGRRDGVGRRGWGGVMDWGGGMVECQVPMVTNK